MSEPDCEAIHQNALTVFATAIRKAPEQIPDSLVAALKQFAADTINNSSTQKSDMALRGAIINNAETLHSNPISLRGTIDTTYIESVLEALGKPMPPLYP